MSDLSVYQLDMPEEESGRNLILEPVYEIARKMFEKQPLHGIFLVNSSYEQTGSALSTLLLEHLSQEYSSVPKIHFPILNTIGSIFLFTWPLTVCSV